jgi:hypothetical protein
LQEVIMENPLEGRFASEDEEQGVFRGFSGEDQRASDAERVAIMQEWEVKSEAGTSEGSPPLLHPSVPWRG